MNPLTFLERLGSWLAYLPIRFAYRIIWLCAKLNLGSARDVYRAMWDANLALPEIQEVKRSDGKS